MNGKNNMNINEITPTIYYYYLDQFHKELWITFIHDMPWTLFTLSRAYAEEQEKEHTADTVRRVWTQLFAWLLHFTHSALSFPVGFTVHNTICLVTSACDTVIIT